MYKFYYFGRNKYNGSQIRGSFLAESEVIAKQRLLAAGILVETIKKAPKWLFKVNNFIARLDFFMWPISKQRLKEFNFLMASLLKSGFPLDDALQLVQIAVSKRLKKIVTCIHYDIITGKGLVEAFLPYERIFSRNFINNLKKIQIGGNVVDIFRQMSDLEDSMDMMEIVLLPRIPQIFFIVFLVSIAGYFGSGYLKSLLDIAKYVNLPVNYTSISLISSSVAAKRFWYLIIPFVIVIFMIPNVIKAMPKFKYFLDWLWLHIPFLNTFIKSKTRYAFFSTLSSSLKSGKVVQNALLETCFSINNIVLHKQIHRMGVSLQEGKSVGVSLRGVQLFTGVYSQLLKVSAAGSKFPEAVEKLKLFSGNEFELKLMILSQLVKFGLYIVIIALSAWIATGALLLYTSIIMYLLTPQ